MGRCMRCLPQMNLVMKLRCWSSLRLWIPLLRNLTSYSRISRFRIFIRGLKTKLTRSVKRRKLSRKGNNYWLNKNNNWKAEAILNLIMLMGNREGRQSWKRSKNQSMSTVITLRSSANNLTPSQTVFLLNLEAHQKSEEHAQSLELSTSRKSMLMPDDKSKSVRRMLFLIRNLPMKRKRSCSAESKTTLLIYKQELMRNIQMIIIVP